MGAMISLVVCTLGRTAPLRRLLQSLSRQTCRSFEIIVVDQNPAGFLDGVLDEYPSLPIYRLRSAKGLSRGRNVGLRHASGAIIGFPDDDCWYDRDVLEFVNDYFELNGETDVLSGRTIDADGKDSVNRYAVESGAITRANVFATGNSNTIFVRRNVIDSVSGFDETLGVGAATPFQAGEESDFLLRCLDLGHRGRYERNFTVRHDQIEESVKRLHAYSVGFGRVARLHKLGRSLFFARNVRTVLGGCLRIAKGDLHGARQRYICLAGSMRGYVAPLRAGSARQIGLPQTGGSDGQ